MIQYFLILEYFYCNILVCVEDKIIEILQPSLLQTPPSQKMKGFNTELWLKLYVKKKKINLIW